MTENIIDLAAGIAIQGEPETEIIFSVFIIEYIRLIGPDVTLPSVEFLTNLIGLFEGDGSFVTPIGSSLFLRISQSTLFMDTLLSVQSTLGFGNISVSTNCVHSLNFIDKHSLYLIVLLLNGNLVISKRKLQYINFMSSCNGYLSSGRSRGVYRNIVPYFRNLLPSLSNSWFSGIFSAEGSFSASFYNNKPQLEAGITQKHLENYVIIYYISLMLGNPVGRGVNYNPVTQITAVDLSNALVLINLRNYLMTYPMIGLKQQDFLKFVAVHERILRNDHMNEEILAELMLQASNINTLKKGHAKVHNYRPKV